MHNPLITVLTVNYNTSDFVELMLYALKRLTLNPYRVIICDNGSGNRDILSLVKTARRHKNVELVFREQTRPGSVAHGEALDILVEMVSTKYTVILDSDCTFLIKNWDEILINKLNEEVKIIGTQLDTSFKSLKPLDFPMPYAVLFETSVFKELDISCMPGDVVKGEDSCWEWKPKYLGSGYRGEILNMKNTRNYKEGPFNSVLCAEYYLAGIKKIFASHFGRGGSDGAAKYLKWLNVPVVSEYIKRFYGHIEKRKWLSKCKEIISKQL